MTNIYSIDYTLTTSSLIESRNLVLERLSHYYIPPNTFIVFDKFLAVRHQ
jgi:hypothetical protein